ncbi:hypothetical protein HOP50_02g17620 [Chloropicon primus]|uniref:ShKT domain-containing protein n=1 Tax=Chloropicon primus TaxID=1764295 RepID=A0A5B8MFT5_9CHLO|nr:hypothetical protein A3770_02p17650 [Chloropicon primus]UPQ98456.1 hypothetical protein HOP50_02g17620 [Chloropicon primus]|mmetsp:Transcript_670/g.1978  ORF Transcript_670/g.1978 Transcript_670/m.1978 type:complete len:282 (-) Transcript_670:52-897(-)|eukprot:QDZ19247.1 hypothetical protein A3770_02p17650 [Chloropicon primus]
MRHPNKAIATLVAAALLLGTARAEGFRAKDDEIVPSDSVLVNATASPTNASCADDLWDDPSTTCEEHKEWGQCFEDFMIKKGQNEENDVVGVLSYCARTCGRCPGDVWDPALYFERTGGRSLYLGEDALVEGCRNEEGLTCEVEVETAEPVEPAEAEPAETTAGGGCGFSTGRPEYSIPGGKSEDECRANFASLGDLRGLQSDTSIMSCVTSYGSQCCSGVNRYLGKGSGLHGCACKTNLLNEVLGMVPSFARPILQGAISACNVPTVANGQCKAAECRRK